jgi:hypothetical protein
MKSSVTKAFRKCLERLPASVQEQADKRINFEAKTRITRVCSSAHTMSTMSY